MDITFDLAKDKINLAKHGVSLADAKFLEWDEMVSWLDERFDYDEQRICGLAPLGNTLYFIAFVERNDAPHVISLRKAINREVKRYAEYY
ncbi:MAG TPA: BrnT family toxin [Burkholderiaceae bacterium]|jgi:uncharacterized DUF497 family protein|nr:BrnT family toxin [Burkholderiaceae bacterium]